MSTVSSPPRHELRPPSADSQGTGLAMSLIAHAVLIAALTLGVQWRTEEPAGVEAELWAAVPESAAPPAAAEPTPPPPPPPTPTPKVEPPPKPAKPVDDSAEREAQIAVEKAKRLQREKDQAADEAAKKAKLAKDKAEKDKADKERAEREKQDQAAKDKAVKDKAEKDKADKAAQAKLEQLRQDNIRRMNEQLGGSGAPGSTGQAARDAGPSANYAGRIKARIKPNIVLTDTLTGNPSAEVEVLVGPDGSITGRRLVKSSGSKEWDDTVLRAIDKTGMLPRDTDGRVPPKIVIAFKPFE